MNHGWRLQLTVQVELLATGSILIESGQILR
jgi:hypothetical protein